MSNWNEMARDAMKRRGMTCANLATELGVHQTTVSKWMTGRSHPGSGMIRRIAGILGMAMSDLYGKDAVDTQERQLLDAFHQMTACEREHLLKLLNIGVGPRQDIEIQE
jgi:transcriptional regulator with XRE-family HTH domain